MASPCCRSRAATWSDPVRRGRAGSCARRDHRERGPPRLPTGRLGGGHPPRAAHGVLDRALGAVRHGRRPDAGARPVLGGAERLAELVEAWDVSAWEHQIFPLDEGTGYRYLLRPPWTERYDRPVVIQPGTPSLDRWRSQRLILWRDVTITATVSLREGDAGVLVAHGDQGGGYSMYLDDTGELVAVHNGYGLERELRGPVVAPGPHDLELRITCPGNNVWDLALAVDGVEVAAAQGFRLLMAMAPFQGIDVGIDRRSPVSWPLYQRHGTFPFSGTLHQVAYAPRGPGAKKAGKADSPNDFMEVLRDWGRRFE